MAFCQRNEAYGDADEVIIIGRHYSWNELHMQNWLDEQDHLKF